MKGEIENSEIPTLPVAFIIKQTFEKGNCLPPSSAFHPDQVSDFPKIRLLLFYSFIKSPKEIGQLPPRRIFFPAEDPEQWKKVPLKSLVFKWKEIKKRECRAACFLPLIIEKRPDPERILLFDTLVILFCPNSSEEEDAMGLLLNISHLVLLQLIEGIKDKDSSQFPFLLFNTIERIKSKPVKVFPLQGLKEWPGKVPLFKAREPISGMGEKRPEIGLTLERFRLS